jgi:hypothetical protein
MSSVAKAISALGPSSPVSEWAQAVDEELEAVQASLRSVAEVAGQVVDAKENVSFTNNDDLLFKLSCKVCAQHNCFFACYKVTLLIVT